MKAEKDLAKANAKLQEADSKFKDYATKTLKSETAARLASELSTTPKVLLPHILSRLSVDFEGDEPELFILDDKGERSRMTPDQLKQNFRDNADFKGIITATRASGGQASRTPNTGGSGVPSGAGNPPPPGTSQPADLSKLSGKELAAHIRNVRAAAGDEVASA